MTHTENGAQGRRITRPIRRGVVIGMAAFFAVLSIALSLLSYAFVSGTLYYRYNTKLDDIIAFVEHNADADDLRRCLETGEKSEKYGQLQALLNAMVDDFELEYLYIIVPSAQTMTNVVSATSAAEFAAGGNNMELLETTDAYSPEELQRYLAYWEAGDVSFFEETSAYGSYYTACKPLRDSAGETVALVCADLSIESLHAFIRRFMLVTVLAIAVLCSVCGMLMMRRMQRRIIDPIHALEQKSYEYAARAKASGDGALPAFDAPDIRTGNEVQSLAETISGMAADMQKYITEAIVARERASKAEEEAEAAARIAELTGSVSALLTHMPAMTFSKDVGTGQYLACNRAFAEYAHKATPQDVVGLTDFEIFDRQTAEHFVADDRKALSMDAPYVLYEDVADAAGQPRQFQTTKLKFTDATGRQCLLGMSVDVTEMMTVKRERMAAEEAYAQAVSAGEMYSRIAHALSTDYFNIFYVDLETERFIEYTSHWADDDLTEERQGDDFFNQSRADALKHIHPNDREAFVRAFTKENVVSALDESGAFTLQYRLLTGDGATHVAMKATRMMDDARHIIIGVNSIEAQMRQQEAEERIQEERTTYARITALSGDYIAIYTVDPATGHYTEYATTPGNAGLGLARAGEDFFAQAQRQIGRRIFVEDLEKLSVLFTRENVMREIGRSGMFVLDYRLMIEGIPTYVRLKAATVEEKDGPQLIIGVSNIDAQVKREQEYANNLMEARNKANIDALTGVKNKHAYIDIEAQLDNQIREGRSVEFAIVVFDLNDLKSVNDTQGHRAGDDYIRDASAEICGIFKRSPVFRVGGDEFAVIAQGLDYRQIDQLLAQLEANNEQAASQSGIIIAYGMARYSADGSVARVFERADANMYESKRRMKGE